MVDKFDIQWQLDTKPALHILRVKLPNTIIEEMNDHIDKVIIPNNSDYSDGLVGQIRQDKKSAQLEYNLFETSDGRKLKALLDQMSNMYLKEINFGDCLADVFESWTIHSYAGDYNPLHDHGVRTKSGLSMILYLKVPECIEKLENPNDKGGNVYMNESSGEVDGFTYFNWAPVTNQLYQMLYQPGESYVKPEVGILMVFPNWLKHAVMPFFGKGERRTLSANANIIMSEHFDFKNAPKEQLESLLTKLRQPRKEKK